MKYRSFLRQAIQFLLLAALGFGVFTAGCSTLLHTQFWVIQSEPVHKTAPAAPPKSNIAQSAAWAAAAQGRPRLDPLPPAQEVWNCDVIVVGGSLGGVAAAAHAMQSGATTCLTELTPWLGGQISAQGVSALDESRTMAAQQRFSKSWINFRRLIEQQWVKLPAWENLPEKQPVARLNSCWVGQLCFPPQAGAAAAQTLLETAARRAPGSRWGTSIAFKGAAFDASGEEITAIYAVRRVPRQKNNSPQGRLSQELQSWYAWDPDAEFEKIPLRLQARPGKRLLVIDATDTGELVGWAGIPYRLGSDAKAIAQEQDAPQRGNSDCTQAVTFPFVLAIHDDRGAGLKTLSQVKPTYYRREHQRSYSLGNMPMFAGKGFFNYRRIVSTTRNNPFRGTAAAGDMTVVNWTQGNDWNWMNPPLILNDRQLQASGQRQNWMGGISPVALKHAEDHALLFAQWLLETQSQRGLPLSYLSGPSAPMGTVSGLSMAPYIREGRRIIGRQAYGQREFMLREADLRYDQSGGRDFSPTAIGVIHYDIDIHGCRYRNWQPAWEATKAPVSEFSVRPTQLPLESLIPQQINNLLIGGKSIAVSHIANAVTRTHYSEWSIGAAAGSTAGWLVTQAPAKLLPGDIVAQHQMPRLSQYLLAQGLQLEW